MHFKGGELKTTGSNSEREEALRTTLKKRLDEIEKLLDGDEDAALKEEQLPKTLQALRVMNVPEHGIFPIGSPSTLNRKQSPHLRDLIDRTKDILIRCKSHRRRPRVRRLSVTERNRHLKRELRKQKLVNAGLARALHESESERDLLKNNHDSVRRMLDIEKRKVAELLRASGRFPFKVVRPEE